MSVRRIIPNAVIDDISSMEYETKLRAVRDLKNSIIGDRTKKTIFIKLGAVPLLVDILMNEDDHQLIIQAAAAIGSFACGSEDEIKILIQEQAVQSLVKNLSRDNPKIIETIVRSLKILYTSPLAPRELLFKGNTIPILIKLLDTPNDVINELAASLLAKCCETEEQQKIISSSNGIEQLSKLLYSKYPKAQEGALDALSSLTRENETICKTIASNEKIVQQTIKLVKDRRPEIRLLAVKCIANLSKAGVLGDTLNQNELSSTVLPTIVRLFSEEGQIKEEAPFILAKLIVDNEELQKAACEADAVSKLTQFLRDPDASDKLKEAAFTALSAICILTEEGRRAVVESKVLPNIVEGLESKNEKIRIAACECARGLSRSVKQLRTSLVDAGIATPLIKLLDDKNIAIQCAASAALCNIVLDFSPMKKLFIENKGISKLVEFTQSMEGPLRLNAVWALKNLVYRSDTSIKEAAMKELTYDSLFNLLNDSDSEIQEQTMNFIRNLAFGEHEDVDALLNGGGKRLIEEIIKKLDSEHSGILTQTLYVVCNIAAGNEEHKQVIMKPEILSKVLKLTEHKEPSVVVGAVWVIINLTWEGDSGVQKRIKIFQDLGAPNILKPLLNHTEIDVRDRVKQALEQLQ